MYRKSTLRMLKPKARKMAKAISQIQSGLNQLKKIVYELDIHEKEVVRLTRALSFMTEEAQAKNEPF